MGLEPRVSIYKKPQGNRLEKALTPSDSQTHCTEYDTNKLLSDELYYCHPALCPFPHSSLCQLTVCMEFQRENISVHLSNTYGWMQQQQLLCFTWMSSS